MINAIMSMYKNLKENNMNHFKKIVSSIGCLIILVGITACSAKNENLDIPTNTYTPPNYASQKKDNNDDIKQLLIDNRWIVQKKDGTYKYNFDDIIATEYAVEDDGSRKVNYYGYLISDDTIELRQSESSYIVFDYSLINGELTLICPDSEVIAIDSVKKNYTTADFGEDVSGITDILHDHCWSARFENFVDISYEFDSDICTQHLHYNNLRKAKKSIQMLYRIEKDAIILLSDTFEEIVLPYTYSDGILTLASQFGPDTNLLKRPDVLTINDSISSSFIYDPFPTSSDSHVSPVSADLERFKWEFKADDIFTDTYEFNGSICKETRRGNSHGKPYEHTNEYSYTITKDYIIVNGIIEEHLEYNYNNGEFTLYSIFGKNSGPFTKLPKE